MGKDFVEIPFEELVKQNRRLRLILKLIILVLLMIIFVLFFVAIVSYVQIELKDQPLPSTLQSNKPVISFTNAL